ncbi:signal peptidase I [Pyrococcus sp. ST04]|uniref:signal peptidase I n=1 Tax=Pyrococcus sp. ST04 TaxID=1183377 RepID=UPI000260589A|nr:signal peptidase I [Pyrococcus sp. ST04]AFK22207.1 putative signal peptidase I [Pyrococcus sp. ST04]
MRASEVIMMSFVMAVLIPSVIGFIVGRPVFVSYVYSDSMYPTLKRWDVFFINPLAKGDVGDIIVFNLSGKWTVHRVYAITSEGYITKGDNNVATDQQGGKNPPIKEDQIIGKVITIGGKPLKIPELGKHLNSPIGAIALTLVGGLLLASGEQRRKKRRKVIVIDSANLYTALSALLVLSMIFVGSMNWGKVEITYASTMAGGQREGWYLPGSIIERNITIRNNALIPMVLVVDGKIVSKDVMILKGREEVNVKANIDVPLETRVYTEAVNVHSYYPILPKDLVLSMYNINPYLPLLVEGLIVFFALLLLKPLLGEPEVIGRFRI